MATAKLTLVGMYQYDTTLFSSLVLPDGIDKETFIANLIMSKGEFELLYPDREFLKTAIMVWGNKWYHTFNKWITALNIEYDPLNNYDRHEEWQDNEEGKRKESNSATNTESNSMSGSFLQNTDSEGTNQNINTVSAYNSNAWQNHDKSDGAESDSTESTGSSSGTEEREKESEFNGNIADTKDSKHIGHMYGNIGVTTSQRMLELELDIAKWNLYNQMADVFSNELLIGVY